MMKLKANRLRFFACKVNHRSVEALQASILYACVLLRSIFFQIIEMDFGILQFSSAQYRDNNTALAFEQL